MRYIAADHLVPAIVGWAAIATLATWLMTLFINRTEHRDTEAAS
jgi:hypothetical protein